MTDYATQSDISDNMKGATFTAVTAVTDTTLANMLSQESAVIDQHIIPRYTLPITDASALLFLEKICIDLVVYRVKTVLQPKSALPQPDGKIAQVIVSSSPHKEAMRMLRAILKGEMTLPGESIKAINFISSTAVNNDHTTLFDDEEQQW